jgi:hypothetical protein
VLPNLQIVGADRTEQRSGAKRLETLDTGCQARVMP